MPVPSGYSCCWDLEDDVVMMMMMVAHTSAALDEVVQEGKLPVVPDGAMGWEAERPQDERYEVSHGWSMVNLNTA